MSRYRIFESVGARIEQVRDYDDLEIHHPSQRGRERGRAYATVEGEREEVLKTRTRSGERMVSKDFILQDERGSARVPVPSPVDGHVGRVDRANGLVAIYDRPDGELLAQVRHLDLRGSDLNVGDRVRYGEALGIQGGFGRGNPSRYGVHVHMDFNEAHLHRLDRYLRDMDRGVLTPASARAAAGHRPDGDMATRAAPSSTVLEEGSRGHGVERLQRALTRLGFEDASGRPLVADGDFGRRTREAVEAFQRERGLQVDGRVGRDTQAEITRSMQQLVTAPAHPQHALYRQATDAVARLERSHGLPGGAHSERIAGAVCLAAAQEGLNRIDRVELNHDRSLIRAIEVSAVCDEPGLNRATQPMATAAAAAASLAASSEALLRHADTTARTETELLVQRPAMRSA